MRTRAPPCATWGQDARDETLRPVLEALIDRAQAVDAAAESLGDRWDAFAKDLLSEIEALGPAVLTEATARRILAQGGVTVAGGDVLKAESGGVVIKDLAAQGSVFILTGVDAESQRTAMTFFREVIERPGSQLEHLDARGTGARRLANGECGDRSGSGTGDANSARAPGFSATAVDG